MQFNNSFKSFKLLVVINLLSRFEDEFLNADTFELVIRPRPENESISDEF